MGACTSGLEHTSEEAHEVLADPRSPASPSPTTAPPPNPTLLACRGHTHVAADKKPPASSRPSATAEAPRPESERARLTSLDVERAVKESAAAVQQFREQGHRHHKAPQKPQRGDPCDVLMLARFAWLALGSQSLANLDNAMQGRARGVTAGQ